MAGIRLGRGGRYLVNFRWEGRKCEFATDFDDELRARSRAADVEDFRRRVLRGAQPVADNVADMPRWIASLGREGFKVKGKKEKLRTLDELVKQYLESRRNRIGSRTKPLSHASYQSDVYRLRSFQDYSPTSIDVALSAENLRAYKDSLLTADETAVSVRHKLRTVKALVEWAYDGELLEDLPRCIRRYNDVDLPAPTPHFFTVKQIKALYEKAPANVRLWMLLGLNCGFTQRDISSLSADMLVDGHVIRDRKKTGVESDHKLWPVTLDALREQAGGGPLLLTANNGQPLVRQSITPDGAPSKTDTISQAWRRLKAPLPFKCLRKTAANAIAKRYQDKPWLVELFLAHADPRMRKHYTRQHYDELHAALDWLRAHFGLESPAGQ